MSGFARYILGICGFAMEVALIWWAATSFLKWNGARSSAARERALFKQRLPDWIKGLETFLLGPLLCLGLVGSVIPALDFYELLHSRRAGTPAMILILIPSFFFALMFSMFAVNFIEWIIPALRRVNEKAMEGLPAASFHQSNKDFLRIVVWAAPACLLLWIIGFVLN